MESQDQVSLVGAAEPADPRVLPTPRRGRAARLGGLQRSFWTWLRAGGGLWLPLLVCAAGSVLSVVAGGAFVSYETRQLESTLDNSASAMARAIEIQFGREVDDLRAQGAAWSEFGTPDQRKWESEADLFMRRSKSILAIEWKPLRLASGSELKHETVEGVQVLEALRRDGEYPTERHDAIEAKSEAFLGPYTALGHEVFEQILPILKDKDVQIVSAVLDPALLVESAARGDEHIYSLTVGDRVLCRRGTLADPASVSTKQATIDLPRGDDWTLTVQPDPAVQTMGTRLPRWIVLSGLIISVLLAGMVRLGQATWSGSRDLIQSNAQLSGRLQEIELDNERMRTAVIELQDERQELKKENKRLSDEAQARGEEVVHQDSVVAELEAFTYSVSHDLRSPLGAILNYAAALAEDCSDQLDANGREYLGRISGSARSAVSMMDGLLVFSRVGRHELRRAKVDVREVVREVYDELSRSMKGAPPELSMGELPPVQADPTLLRVLVTNLLSNAFKFTSHSEAPKLEVGGYVQGAETVFYFEDNGIGFDMQDAGRLFGVFERLHGSTQYAGHGVGLAVVERIARRHGGTVRAEAVLGKGATFFVSLPVRPSAT